MKRILVGLAAMLLLPFAAAHAELEASLSITGDPAELAQLLQYLQQSQGQAEAPAAPQQPATQPDQPQPPQQPDAAENSLAEQVQKVYGGAGAGAAVSPIEGENAFKVRGSFDLAGKIAFQGEGRWVFDGAITFPTGGYKIGELRAVPVEGGQEAGAPMVALVLPVALPPEDAIVTQALDEHELHLEIEAPKNARFVFSFEAL